MPNEKQKEDGIWCGLCGEKILSLKDLEKAKNGKIGFLDKRRTDWIRMVAGISGVQTHNKVHSYAMMRVYRHFMKKHKKEIAREIKKKNGEAIWSWVKIYGKEKMERLGVVF